MNSNECSKGVVSEYICEMMPSAGANVKKSEYAVNFSDNESSSESPKFPDFPLCDRVKELKLDEYPEEEAEFYKDLEDETYDVYPFIKNMPDSLAKKHYPLMCRRFMACEKRIKQIENILWKLPREDKSMEEDRFEILLDLLNKVSSGLYIWHEFLERKLKFTERLALEDKLVNLMNAKMDFIEKTCLEFDKLKGDKVGVKKEREEIWEHIKKCSSAIFDIRSEFSQMIEVPEDSAPAGGSSTMIAVGGASLLAPAPTQFGAAPAVPSSGPSAGGAGTSAYFGAGAGAGGSVGQSAYFGVGGGQNGGVARATGNQANGMPGQSAYFGVSGGSTGGGASSAYFAPK